MIKVLPLTWLMCACTASTISVAMADASNGSIDAGITVHTVHSPDPILQEQVKFMAELIRFAEPVRVLHEVEEGPLYDPDTQEIWMPGSFADNIRLYFDDEDAPVADVYFHTLMHEIGHVLF